MSGVLELESLRDEVLHAGSRGASATSIQKYLRVVRDLKVHEPDLVVKAGLQLLELHRSALSVEEFWLVQEQVAYAALEIGVTSVAVRLQSDINKKFPSSVRAQKLRGAYFEATGKLDEARAVYVTLLQNDPVNQSLLKRLVALEKSAGNINAAIDRLKEYVNTFSTDQEAWEELAQLYLQNGMLAQAQFCFEELLLHAPGQISYLVRYADILYTLGGTDNVQTAVDYYSKAIELSQGRNVRALYGICCCAAQLQGGQGSKSVGSHAQLASLSAQSLVRWYTAICPSKLKLVHAMLAEQGLSIEHATPNIN